MDRNEAKGRAAFIVYHFLEACLDKNMLTELIEKEHGIGEARMIEREIRQIALHNQWIGQKHADIGHRKKGYK
jgi:hypothetical protein